MGNVLQIEKIFIHLDQKDPSSKLLLFSWFVDGLALHLFKAF